MTTIPGLCLAVIVAAQVLLSAACASHTQDYPVASMSAHPPDATTNPTPQPRDAKDCDSPQFIRSQFVGSWGEADTDEVNTLNDDGTLQQGGPEAGTWKFTAWASTPTPTTPPQGMGNSCVLWLHTAATDGVALDLVYFPLAVSPDAIQLSFVGRGNTIDWVRKNPPT